MTILGMFLLCCSTNAMADVCATRTRADLKEREVVYVGIPIKASSVPIGQVYWLLGI